MSKDFGLMHQEKINNYIKTNIITLFPDNDNNNIHFLYKNIEVKTDLNIPYLYQDPLGRINQIVGESFNVEMVQEDYFRHLIININIKTLMDDEDGIIDDEDENDIIDDNEEESFEDRLKKHFPGLFLTDKQLKNYDDAANKIQLLDDIMMEEQNSIFVFSSLYGLKIFNDKIIIYAPGLTKSNYDWMFYACTIIDKILSYYNDDEEEEYLNEDDE